MLRKAVTVVFGMVCTLQVVAGASAQPLPSPIPQYVDPLLQNLTIPADAPAKGMWAPSLPPGPPGQPAQQNWPLIAMHMAVMPDGKVVTFGSPVNTDTILAEVFDVWNPRRSFTDIAHRQLLNLPTLGLPTVDSFCAASVLLGTGELLTSGGNNKLGSESQTVNTRISVLNTVRNSVSTGAVPSLSSPRYYATQTVLADGRVLITGGSWAGGPATWGWQDPQNHVLEMSIMPEVYTPGSGWHSLVQAASWDAFGADENRWWYPRQWVAPDGNVFGFSARQMWYLDPTGNGSLTLTSVLSTDPFGGPVAPNIGATSTAVMYDTARILQLGGNGRSNGNAVGPNGEPEHDWTDSSPYATIIDITMSSNPQLSPATPMHFGRQWANATVLPNGHVLVTGGTRKGNSNDENDVVRVPEIWNPGNGPGGSWTEGRPASEVRVYHSTAVLLPNGAVLTAGGGGPPAPLWQSPGRLNAEVYYPPYFFQTSGSNAILAARPRILSMNARKFNHGATIQAEFQAGQPIASAALIGLGSATHGFDMGQRFYRAPSLTLSGTRVSFTVPGPTYTPPGYYLLFVSNAAGVPSEGVIIAIGANVAPPPPRQHAIFDHDGDGWSDIAVWRPITQSSVNWFIRSSRTGALTTYWFGDTVGGVPDVPVAGDYDADGISDIAVWRPSEGKWYIRRSSTGTVTTNVWGDTVGGVPDVPVPADYDGDGRTDIAVWRPSEGKWYLLYSGGGQDVFVWGDTVGGVPDVPVPGDYDGDGRTDIAVWRPGDSNWYILYSGGGQSVVAWGEIVAGIQDVPVPGDYDGDGKTDITVWRPGTSQWFIRESTTGSLRLPVIQFGEIIAGVQDIPIEGH